MPHVQLPGDVRIYYEFRSAASDLGDSTKPSVILLAPCGLDSTFLEPYVEALREDYAVTTVELRGQGRTIGGASPNYDYWVAAADLGTSGARLTHYRSVSACAIPLTSRCALPLSLSAFLMVCRADAIFRVQPDCLGDLPPAISVQNALHLPPSHIFAPGHAAFRTALQFCILFPDQALSLSLVGGMSIFGPPRNAEAFAEVDATWSNPEDEDLFVECLGAVGEYVFTEYAGREEEWDVVIPAIARVSNAILYTDSV